MITVYVLDEAPASVRNVTRDLRALWALEETGLPYRIVRAGRSIRRFGRVPSIDDAGFTLYESAAIALYLAEKSGRLLPATREGRALAQRWAFLAVSTVERAIAELFSIDARFADQPWARQRRPAVVEQVTRRLAALDGELAGRPHLLGPAFSAPDILMATALRLAPTELLDAAPHVAAYLARCEARPAWRRIAAEHPQRLAA